MHRVLEGVKFHIWCRASREHESHVYSAKLNSPAIHHTYVIGCPCRPPAARPPMAAIGRGWK